MAGADLAEGAALFRPTFARRTRLLRLLVALAEEPGGAGDVGFECACAPLPRPALFCLGGGHVSGLLWVFGDQRAEKYVAAHAHGAAVLDHVILRLDGCHPGAGRD